MWFKHIGDYFLQPKFKFSSCPEALRKHSGHYEQVGLWGQSKKGHLGMGTIRKLYSEVCYLHVNLWGY